ncbi:MAG: hypothetical protein IJM43_04710 [Bacteroidaceae bacterium]|nr:hypothetical protein [Bacteroidaceae bacterium]
MKRFLMAACLFVAAVGLVNAQTARKQVVENGGTGPYKAEVVEDVSCPKFTTYRPQDLKNVVAKTGKLPVIVYANGGCANNNVEMRFLLSELCSYGYVAIAIGPYDEEDVVAKWKDVLTYSYPETKAKVVLANGEVIEPKSPEEVKVYQEQMRAQIEKMMKEQAEAQAKAAKKGQPLPTVQETYPRMLLEALDWLTDQNADPKSDYYHCLDLDHVAAMGQSCGGAQVLGVAHDPRIKTCVMLNTGIADMEMQGTTKEAINNLHQPMFYLIGGPADVAFPNAQKDFDRIENVPVVMMNTLDGHSGTYYEKNGGSYAVAVLKWLNWQFKGNVGEAAFFLDDDFLKYKYPDWKVVRKNF